MERLAARPAGCLDGTGLAHSFLVITSNSRSSWSHRQPEVVGRASCAINETDVPINVRDLNASGFSLETNQALKIGSVYDCALATEGRILQVSARVTEHRYRPGSDIHRLGFAFQYRTPGERRAVERLTSAAA
jgi:hypothetical protein